MAINARAEEIQSDVGGVQVCVRSIKLSLSRKISKIRNINTERFVMILTFVFHHMSSFVDLLKSLSIGIFMSIFASMILNVQDTPENQIAVLIIGMILGCFVAIIYMRCKINR